MVKGKQKVINAKVSTGDAELLKKRFLAFLIDWVITAFLINIIIVFGRTIQLGEVSSNNYLPSFEGISGYVYGALALFACFIYMVIFPWSSKRCQTLGKKLMHLEIVDKDGKKAGLKELTFRFLVTLLFEPALFNFSLVLYTMISMWLNFPLDTVFTVIYWVITVISLLLGASGKFGGMYHERFGRVQKEV